MGMEMGKLYFVVRLGASNYAAEVGDEGVRQLLVFVDEGAAREECRRVGAELIERKNRARLIELAHKREYGRLCIVDKAGGRTVVDVDSLDS
jgi:hypothetical protein